MSYCHRCDRSFSSSQALEQHVENSSSHFVCNECRIDLASDDELHEHCRQLHWYCSTCKEVFESAEDLRVHRRSPDHHSKCLSCPVASCKKQFASVSAIMQHLERGDCRPASGARPSAADGSAAGRNVEQQNPNVIFVDSSDHPSSRDAHKPRDRCGKATQGGVPPAYVIAADGSRIGRLAYGVVLGHGGGTPTSGLATEASYNGSRYECILCHKTFMSLHGLNNHLRAVHTKKSTMYRCEHADGSRACGKKMRGLRKFVEHVESGGCGVKKFKKEFDA